MDYYKRKALSQQIVKKMLKEKFTDQEICLAVEDKFQLSPNSTMKYLERLRSI